MKRRIIDFHCDVLFKMLYEGKIHFDQEELLDVSLPRMRQGGVGMQVFALYLEDALLTGPPRFSQVLRAIDLLRERIHSHPDVQFIRYREDLDTWARNPNAIGSILSLEGVDGLEGDMVYVRTAYELGARFVGLTWNHANWAVDGTLEPRQGGFTNKGRQFIRECDKLGLMIDVSHLNEHGFWELLDLTGRPIIASHSNAASVRPHPRNLSDEQIKAIIARDGRIGVVFLPTFIREGEHVTIDDLLKHIDRICELGGANHIMFGSDFDGIEEKVERLEHAGHYGNLVEALEKRYTSEFVDGITGGNAFRLLQTYLPQRTE
ncbi:dipeptidase [Paenibacillus sp. 481]|uniref:dipeptidase n=1 Tax=Paenibacillus sp. 481 TaxID=2835869 RepID=UPI001E539243|nr:dipeptidase [Paenibacillus sp. 481]UHA73864.1 dipeptidase [Paenibacillus sp. 481]